MIPGLLRSQAEARGDAVFLRFGDRSLSFGEMEERSGRVANLLLDIGVRRGDKVCLWISNRPEFLELWFGLAKLGAVMVPLDPGSDGEFRSFAARHSDSSVLATDDSVLRYDAFPDRTLDTFRNRLWIGGPETMPVGYLQYEKAVASFPSSRPGGFFPTIPSDVMSILYTPGTTGPPKGAMISHANYCNAGTNWAERVVRTTPGDVFFSSLPLSRIQTQTLAVMSSFVSGVPLVLREGFDASTFFEEIRRSGCTVVHCSGPMIASLLDLPNRPDDARNPVRLAFGGTAPGGMRREFEKRFDVRIVETFHLTECGGTCLFNDGENAKGGSIGKPVSHYEVKVVDAFGEELPTGMSGEIVLRPRTPNAAFPGYYKEPDRTAESVRNHWFHSGDRGYEDEDGDFYFLDRMKDCIRRRGESVPSSEIEGIVNSHPKVLESAAVGMPSEPGEEEIKVFVVPRPDASLLPEDIVEWCSDRTPRDMHPYMLPRYIELVSGLPKTVAGEPRKLDLRRQPATARKGRSEQACPTPFEQ